MTELDHRWLLLLVVIVPIAACSLGIFVCLLTKLVRKVGIRNILERVRDFVLGVIDWFPNLRFISPHKRLW